MKTTSNAAMVHSWSVCTNHNKNIQYNEIIGNCEAAALVPRIVDMATRPKHVHFTGTDRLKYTDNLI